MRFKVRRRREPNVYTIEQAAKVLQVDERWIRRAIGEGDLRAARFGRVFRIREEDLFTFFDRQLFLAPRLRQQAT